MNRLEADISKDAAAVWDNVRRQDAACGWPQTTGRPPQQGALHHASGRYATRTGYKLHLIVDIDTKRILAVRAIDEKGGDAVQ